MSLIPSAMLGAASVSDVINFRLEQVTISRCSCSDLLFSSELAIKEAVFRVYFEYIFISCPKRKTVQACEVQNEDQIK
jgi:hypothetical protein